MSEPRDLAARRARLAEIEHELARLQGQHDLAMSGFSFDEANALQRRIEALEDDRRGFAVALPPVAVAVEPAPGIVPGLARPRHRRRR